MRILTSNHIAPTTMSALNKGVKPLSHLPQCRRTIHGLSNLSVRSFSSSQTVRQDELQAQPSPKVDLLQPHLVHTPRLERRLVTRKNLTPVGSRRRRAALQAINQQVPFEQQPYQCFQEARKILAADRQEKVQQLDVQRARYNKLRQLQVEPQNEFSRQQRIQGMEKHLEELKVFADINDPVVKRRFEDGKGRHASGWQRT